MVYSGATAPLFCIMVKMAKSGKNVRKSRKKSGKSVRLEPGIYMLVDRPYDQLPYEELVNQATKLKQDELQLLCDQWVKANFQIDLPDPKTTNYDGWLDFFKTVPPARLALISKTAMLGVEAEAALRRWLDILKTPHRIDKIYQGGLRDNNAKSIVELARQDDGQMAVLEAMRDRIAEQLERGTGARDTAALTRELGNIMDQISELKRRQAPSTNTKLGQLLKKRQRDAGVRRNSIEAKVAKPRRTIKQIEHQK